MAGGSASDAALARQLVRDLRTAALATLEPDGGPFASYVTTAPDSDGAPLLLLSKLAAHSRNLERDPRASLLFVREPERGGEDMAATRLTLTGRLVPDDNPACRGRFLDRNPEAARYAGFGDFSLYRFAIGAGHLVAGFGRIVSLPPADLLEAPE